MELLPIEYKIIVLV